MNMLSRFHKYLFPILLLLFVSSVVFAQTTGSSSGSEATVDAIKMLENFNNAYPSIIRLVSAFCYLLGFLLIIRGVFYLKMYGELRTMMSTQTSAKIPLFLILVGSLFVFLPSTYNNISISFFGSASVLSYDQVTTSMNPLLLKSIVGVVQIIGLLSFIKGWMILVANAQQPGGQATVGKAITHIIGGLCAYNILGFTNVIWNTFYGSNLFG